MLPTATKGAPRKIELTTALLAAILISKLPPTIACTVMLPELMYTKSDLSPCFSKAPISLAIQTPANIGLTAE